MTPLVAGLLSDYVDAATDREVPMSEVGVLAQELDLAVRGEPAAASAAVAGVAKLLEVDGPELFVTAMLVGSWVELGADPAAAQGLLRRLPGWLSRAADGDAVARECLEEVWRPAVAVLGAWPQGLEAAREDVEPLARAIASGSTPAGWLVRLFEAAAESQVRVVAPDLGVDAVATQRGVADVAQLTLLVVGALDGLPPEVLACARGEGPQVLPGAVGLPRVLTTVDGDLLPEAAPLSELPVVEGHPFVAALRPDEPLPRPVGRVFATLKAELRI